jgi:hypothetical protein
MIRSQETPIMSADSWLRAAKIEEERLLAEIAKTTLYNQLVAVRAVIALYEGTAAPPEPLEQHGPRVPPTRKWAIVAP